MPEEVRRWLEQTNAPKAVYDIFFWHADQMNKMREESSVALQRGSSSSQDPLPTSGIAEKAPSSSSRYVLLHTFLVR